MKTGAITMTLSGLLAVLAGCSGGGSHPFNRGLAKATSCSKRGDRADKSGVAHLRARRYTQAEVKFREALREYRQGHRELGPQMHDIGDKESAAISKAWDQAHYSLKRREDRVKRKIEAMKLLRTGRAKLDPKTGRLIRTEPVKRPVGKVAPPPM
jgi:hypothetical protein